MQDNGFMENKEKSIGKRSRNKTNYLGVFYYMSKRLGGKGKEKVYYYRFKKDGKYFEEKAGRQYADDMTAARAAIIRAERIEGKRESRKEKRQKELAAKHEQERVYTIDRLWNTYVKYKGGAHSWPNYVTDFGIYRNHISRYLGSKQPHELLPLDIARLKKKLQNKKRIQHGRDLAIIAAKKRKDKSTVREVENRIKQNEKTLSAQTVRHALALLRRLCNFGVNMQLCEGPKFKIELVPVDNEKTEDLSVDQLNRLLIAIDEDIHPHAGPMMKLSLFTGMRRSEMFRLKWNDIKFEQEFIYLRGTKGGRTEKIPLNQAAAELLNTIPRADKDYVFPGRNGQRRDINRQVNRIKAKAGLPKDFRPLHGLRHVFASNLASSGKIDLYTLQKLLTHKDPKMTQRYAHLRDETLKKASNLAGEIITNALEKDEKTKIKIDQN